MDVIQKPTQTPVEHNTIKPVDDEPLSFEAIKQQIQPVQTNIKSIEEWNQIKRECETDEDWIKVKEAIQSAPNLNRIQKRILINYS